MMFILSPDYSLIPQSHVSLLLFFPSPPTITPSLHTLACDSSGQPGNIPDWPQTHGSPTSAFECPVLQECSTVRELIFYLASLTFGDHVVSFLLCPLIFLTQGWQLCSGILKQNYSKVEAKLNFIVISSPTKCDPISECKKENQKCFQAI